MQKQTDAERRFIRLFRKALAKQNSGDVAKAQHLYRRALRIGRHASVYVNLGVIASKQGRRRRAEAFYRQAIKLDPACAIAHNNLGVILMEEGNLDAAAMTYAKAINLGETPESLANMANLYSINEQYAEAMDLCMRALKINPNHPQALSNAALVLWSQNEHEMAIETLRRAIACGADAVSHVNLGMLLLATGQYAEGWQEYNWRFSASKIAMRGPAHVPVWSGREHVQGTLYVWPEQGLGDEIMYAANMAYAASKANRVVWECEPRLRDLLQRGAPANVEVVPMQYSPPVSADTRAQIPVGCVGQLARPSGEAYLKADPERVAKYRAAMPSDKKIVGISWHSSNAKYGHKKSLAHADFAAFTENPDMHCVSLQYGNVDHGALDVMPGLDMMRDIDGVAALIKACDLVVTVSNTVAHLAGALGVPTIVLVSDAGGKLWYWGTGERTPWYASVRIERFTRARVPVISALPETAAGSLELPQRAAG